MSVMMTVMLSQHKHTAHCVSVWQLGDQDLKSTCHWKLHFRVVTYFWHKEDIKAGHLDIFDWTIEKWAVSAIMVEYGVTNMSDSELKGNVSLFAIMEDHSPLSSPLGTDEGTGGGGG